MVLPGVSAGRVCLGIVHCMRKWNHAGPRECTEQIGPHSVGCPWSRQSFWQPDLRFLDWKLFLGVLWFALYLQGSAFCPCFSYCCIPS